MRLLLDRDGRAPELVERVIRWSQADDFWRTNILSPGKLREQFPQLLLKMQAGGQRQRPPPRLRRPLLEYDWAAGQRAAA